MQLLKAILFLALIGITNTATAQKYFSKTGNISFFSATSIENIEAESNSASTIFDVESGKLQWAVLIKSFEFEKALMQEHFNENYMESSTYPKAKFVGTIENLSDLDLSKDGTYSINTTGMLSIHGVSKEVSVPATFEIADGVITGTTTFSVLVADYNIEIPSVVQGNIAESIEIKIKADYALFKKP